MKPFCPLPPRLFRPPEPVQTDSRSGWRFQIWAPEAAAVSVAGDFQGSVSYTHLTLPKRWSV